MMINELTKQYISQHKTENTQLLALKKAPDGVNIKQALLQITGYQIIKNKIPHWAEIENIIYPQRISLEQSSSQNTAYFKSSFIYNLFSKTPYSMVDLTGGMGIDCYFISLHASKTDYVEQDIELCKIATHNFNVLKKSNQSDLSIDIAIHNTSTEHFIEEHLNDKYDLIYADPARRGKQGEKLVSITDCQPNMVQLLPKLLLMAKYVIIKLSPMLDISKALTELKSAKQLVILSSNGECKELLAVICNNCEETEIIAIDIRDDQTTSVPLKGTISEEKNIIVHYSKPLNYIFEPYAAYIKSGLFKTIGNKYNVYKISQHAHLYTSNELKTDFPGRLFEVIESLHFNKKNMIAISSKYTKANISTRNFPLRAEELHKRYKIKNGGNIYIFATTADNNEKLIIVCRKIVASKC